MPWGPGPCAQSAAWLSATRTTIKKGPNGVTNPFQFLQQVRAEVAKIVWPTRREVMLTTVMVFIMAALTAVFFALVDLGIRGGLRGLLGLFG
jgi:preprotein translocase subunit SecE